MIIPRTGYHCCLESEPFWIPSWLASTNCLSSGLKVKKDSFFAFTHLRTYKIYNLLSKIVLKPMKVFTHRHKNVIIFTKVMIQNCVNYTSFTFGFICIQFLQKEIHRDLTRYGNESKSKCSCNNPGWLNIWSCFVGSGTVLTGDATYFEITLL